MSDRIHSVDAMRIVAIGFVVVIHTNPFEGVGTDGNAFNFALETTARFAVPFFFVAAGYFFALGAARRDLTAALVDRVTGLVSLYVYGIVLAAPVFLTATVLPADSGGRDIVRSAIPKLVEFGSPLELLYYGTSVSEILWFLPALVFSYLLIALCLESGLGGYVLPISLGFHLVGLLGSGYTMFVEALSSSVPPRLVRFHRELDAVSGGCSNARTVQATLGRSPDCPPMNYGSGQLAF
ncbi:acyltransferase [Natrinema versiforme]|uniref:Acyltransferase n=1 Tax=Natrinema versiforme TaxID=88724 RepID=A0A4P8WER7_9EURY|nr:acyltransferase [Natrinema versiforme]